MPILKKEDDIFPANLLDPDFTPAKSDARWWACYTTARREKDLMRKLFSRQIPFYGPIITKRYRSPAGRVRNSHIPLFANYVFMLGDEADRLKALETNCLSTCKPILQPDQFVAETRLIHNAISSGAELLPEANLETGDRVRVLSGPFKNYEGIVVRREGKTRLLLTLNFLQQGVSAQLDQCQLERL